MNGWFTTPFPTVKALNWIPWLMTKLFVEVAVVILPNLSTTSIVTAMLKVAVTTAPEITQLVPLVETLNPAGSVLAASSVHVKGAVPPVMATECENPAFVSPPPVANVNVPSDTAGLMASIAAALVAVTGGVDVPASPASVEEKVSVSGEAPASTAVGVPVSTQFGLAVLTPRPVPAGSPVTMQLPAASGRMPPAVGTFCVYSLPWSPPPSVGVGMVSRALMAMLMEFEAVTGAIVLGGFAAESVAFTVTIIGLAVWSAAVAVPERTQFVPLTMVVVNPVPTGKPVNRQLAIGCTPPVVGTLIE